MSIRNRKDAQKIVTLALPAANANANSDSIDLEAVAPGATAEAIELEVALPATPSLADDKDITIHLEDSADDSTFADIASLASIVDTGVATSQGGAGVTRVYKLPPDVRRYIRINAAVEDAGGDNTGVSVTVSLLF